MDNFKTVPVNDCAPCDGEESVANILMESYQILQDLTNVVKCISIGIKVANDSEEKRPDINSLYTNAQEIRKLAKLDLGALNYIKQMLGV